MVSAVLIGSAHTGLARSVLVERVDQLVKVLKWQKARVTAALWADRNGFQESITFMVRNDLVEMADDFGQEIVFYQDSRRKALDLYRNSIVHYLALPSLLSRSLLHGRLPEEIKADVARWIGLFYSEFFVPEEQSSPEGVAILLEEFQSEGWICPEQGRWTVTPEGRDILICLAAQTRSFIETYEAIFHVVLLHGGDIERAQALSEATGALLNARRLGLAGDPEAAVDTSMANALDWLLVRSILSVSVVEEKRSSAKQTLYMPGDRWNELTELHLHLAKAALAL